METKKKNGLTPKVKKLLVFLISFGGTLLALYVGGYVMLIRPAIYVYTAWKAGALTAPSLLRCVISFALCTTAGGGIWCGFDIIAGLFREKEDD